jgi:hypothetical protein
MDMENHIPDCAKILLILLSFSVVGACAPAGRPNDPAQKDRSKAANDQNNQVRFSLPRAD